MVDRVPGEKIPVRKGSELLPLIEHRAKSVNGLTSSDLNGSIIAAAIGQLVSDGTITPGQKLPTVRAVARQLRVSPSTVSEAWRQLRFHAVISTDRRRGTTVRSPRGSVDGRYWHVPVDPAAIEIDLSVGTPDPALLPSIADALTKVAPHLGVSSYLDRPVLPELETELRRRNEFEPESVSVLNGAQDALDRVIANVVSPGDTVIVDDTTFPPIPDMVELAGGRLIPVGADREGMLPEHVEAALAHKPALVVVQPRAHNPTGRSLSANRADSLGSLLEGSDAVIIEDDHSGLVSGAPLNSFAPRFPERVIRIESFSKAFGPDLRVAAVYGPDRLLDPVIRRRHLGPSWTSRLLQQVLLTLLTDPAVDQQVERAADVYRDRRQQFTAALAAQGIHLPPGDGFNLWVPVKNEVAAVSHLATHGIGVAPGHPFRVATANDDPHIRMTVASLATNFESIAAHTATAASCS